MNREAFMARVKAAAAAGREHHVPTRKDLPARVGYCGGGDDLATRFAHEVELVGGKPVVVENLTAARHALAELLSKYAPQSALCWEHPVLERCGVAELLAERHIAAHHYATLNDLPRDAQREAILAAEIGISSVTSALAETGTLVMGAMPGRERVASLAPPVHVAIVTAEQIVPDLFDLFDTLVLNGSQALPSNVTLITGPSKTGDLELRLTTGVHGPGQWHVIVSRSAN